MAGVDDNFYDRADKHIHLSNEQLSDVGSGKVSASMMYSVARFNSWISACRYSNANDMEKDKEENIKYFTIEYEKILRENMDDYIQNFDAYMKVER